jgi:hypothetical protein
MCRSIKVLRDYEKAPANEDIEAAALQFVRKISGFNKPSKVNEESFERAVDEIAGASRRLLHTLEPTGRPTAGKAAS